GLRVESGHKTTGTLVAFLLYLFQIIVPMTSITMFFTQLQKSKGATERIVAKLDEPLEASQTDINNNMSEHPIHVVNVSFAYEKDEPIIKNVSFSVNPGEMIALAGPSGGGKTTIFSLIERFYEPTAGEIKIGELPITAMSMKTRSEEHTSELQ